ncbi:MAG: phosphatase PAP2 family protein [Pyrinomonadaceae bacterium]
MRSILRNPVAWRNAVFLAVISASSVFAQTEPRAALVPAPPKPTASPSASPTPTSSLERNFFKNILRDQRAIWTSPFALRGQDAKWLAPMGLSTALLIATDRRSASEIDDNRHRLSRGFSEAGALYTTGGIAATLYVIGRKTGNQRLRETGLLGAEAIINGQIVATGLKAMTQRMRPRESNNRVRFFAGGDSFPSGHAVSAWSLATVIAYQYKHRPLIKYGAYSVAIAVSISRFTGRKHFLSDVLVGSAIGYGIGRYVYRTHRQKNPAGQDSEAAATKQSGLLPIITPHYYRPARAYGVTLTWRL